jgi:hypothetical protein
MIASLFVASVLMGQVEQVLVNTGTIRSKIYIQAVVNDEITEIPVINNFLPVISIERDEFGNSVKMHLNYIYKFPYNGHKLIHYRTEQPKLRDDEECLRHLRIMNEFMDRLNELVKFQVLPIPEKH